MRQKGTDWQPIVNQRCGDDQPGGEGFGNPAVPLQDPWLCVTRFLWLCPWRKCAPAAKQRRNLRITLL